MSDMRKAFEKYSNQYDNFGDEWQDKGVDEHFFAGWQAARAQQGEGREVAIPFVLGNTYQTVSGELVRFVKVHNEGTSYETMEDESGVNRYTNRAGDMGRVTARSVDYSGNVPPLYTHPPTKGGLKR